MPASHFSNRGFTLIELILFIVVVGVATTGLFAAINSSTINNVNPLFQIRSLELAQAQMDEIIGKRYDENSPNGGFPPCDSGELGALSCTSGAAFGEDTGEITTPVTSTNYDDVDDYSDFSTVPSGYGGYSLNVTVTYKTLEGRTVKLITVTVDSPASEPVTLSAYRGNY